MKEIPVRRKDLPDAVATENVPPLRVMLVLSVAVQAPPGAHVPLVVLCPWNVKELEGEIDQAVVQLVAEQLGILMISPSAWDACSVV